MNWNEQGSDLLAATVARLSQDGDRNMPAPQRIRLLAQSLATMARELEAMLGANEDPAAMPAFPALRNAAPSHVDLGDLAFKAYRDRRRRADIFGDETLFGEPAWDILLDLFVAGERGKRVAVTSACIGSGVPSTTALRWLNVLELRGLVEREDDNSDARRSFVRLTAKARSLMATYYSACQG